MTPSASVPPSPHWSSPWSSSSSVAVVKECCFGCPVAMGHIHVTGLAAGRNRVNVIAAVAINGLVRLLLMRRIAGASGVI
eukprot:4422592-Alexandrium_andersonii.AAC.1